MAHRAGRWLGPNVMTAGLKSHIPGLTAPVFWGRWAKKIRGKLQLLICKANYVDSHRHTGDSFNTGIASTGMCDVLVP